MITSSRIETFEDLNRAMGGAHATRALQAANLIGLFAAVADGPRSLEELAAATRTQPDTLEPLLIICTVIGLLSRDERGYANTSISQEYLVPGAPLYQGNIISHGLESWRMWTEMPRRFRPELGEGRWAGPEDFVLGMHNLAMTGRAELLADMVDLSGRKRLVDIGGGPGTYSVFLCKRNPGLHATVWDLPEAIAIAKKTVAGFEEVADRIDFVEGNWDEDEFGEGHDALLFSNVLHGPSSNPNMKLAKAHRALAPGGLVIVQDFILNDDKLGPMSAAVFNLYMGAFTFAELLELLGAAGFAGARVVYAPEAEGNGVVTATRP